MKKRKTAAFLAALMVCAWVPQAVPGDSGVLVAEAHSGRTDRYGGHRDNKNKSGLGSYHYHCGGHPAHLHENGVCPYASYVEEAAPAVSPEETVMHVFIASAGVFVACMFPIHQFLYLFSTSHGLFSIPLRHTQNLSLPKTSSGKCSNRTGCSLPS